MTIKRIKHFIFAALIGLSIIILYKIVSGLEKENEQVPVREVFLIKDVQTEQVVINISMRDSIVSFGLKFLGTPYVAGASGKDGFDCSGFVYFVFQHFKIKVPRSSAQFKNFGKEISIDSLRKGDVLLFLSPSSNVIGHVGIVVNPKGKESDFIHASSGKEMKVIISSLKQTGYKRRFVKAINVI